MPSCKDLENFKDPPLALATYYQGPASLRQDGMSPGTRAYVDGILALVETMGSWADTPGEGKAAMGA